MPPSSELRVGTKAQRAKRRDPDYSEDRLINWLIRLLIYGAAAAIFLATFRVLPVATETLAIILGMCAAMSLGEVLEPWARGIVAERQVRRLLLRHQIPAVHDVFLSSPDGRRAQLDHVAWLGRSIAVIETKSVTGLVERRGSRWTRHIYGRERALGERTPQQQALNARDVLIAAYPAWGARPMAFTALTHATLGETFADDIWVVSAADLPAVLGRFRKVPDEQARRRWTDLSRFLAANKPTLRERLRFIRSDVLNPRHFSRVQLVGFGSFLASGIPLLMFLAFLMLGEAARRTGFPLLALTWSSQIPTGDLLHGFWSH